MKCIILAAGRGTRMGELCELTPKPMLTIKGRPKLAYTLDALPDSVDEVIFVVGYLGEQIVEYFGDRHMDLRITYVWQDNLSGTAGAVDCVRDLIEDESFMVLMGDDLYIKGDLEKMLHHEYSVLAHQVSDVSQAAYVELYEGQILRDVHEVPHHFRGAGLANTGAYVLGGSYFDLVQVPKSSGSDEYGLPQTLSSAHPEVEVRVVEATDWLPIGTPEALAVAQERIYDFME